MQLYKKEGFIMTSKQTAKIIIDIAMTALFLLLIKPFLTGLEFHEIAGICIALIVLIHNILNIKWIKATAKNLFSDKIKLKTKLMFALNSLLAVLVAVIAVTGVLISKVLFTFITAGGQEQLIFIHKTAAYICLGAIAVHIAVHAEYIAVMFKKMSAGKVLIPLTGVMFSAILALAVYRYFDMNEDISAVPEQRAEYISESTYSGLTSEEQFSVLTADEQIAEVTLSTASEQITSSEEQTVSENDVQITETTTAAEPEVSAEEYLSKLFCTGCPKHCPLSSPRCGKGEAQAETALEEYNTLYGQA